MQTGNFAKASDDLMAEYRADILAAHIAYDEQQTVETRAAYMRAVKAFVDFVLTCKAPIPNRKPAA